MLDVDSINRLIELMFYHTVNPIGSRQAWSVYLTILFLDRFSPLKWLTSTCAYFVTRN